MNGAWETRTLSEEATIEQRLAGLEVAVADLQRRLPAPTPSNWLDKLIGSISDKEAFLEVLALGRAYREADGA